MQFIRHDNNHQVWKGLAAGVVAGLAASWVMSQFQVAWSKLSEDNSQSQDTPAQPDSTPQHGIGRWLEERGSEEGDENATERAANALAEKVLDHGLTKSQKETGGTLMHYAMGATSGGIYGALAEVTPGVTAGTGAPFGAAVWLIADEAIVPTLGLSKWPNKHPLSTHTYALASHVVYGLTTELVRRAVRQVL
jgi:putative membrane protein